MAVRERINRVKIEHWRVSQVPCLASEEIYQGDMLVWDLLNKRATKAVSISGGTFLGISETTNPVESAGSSRFLSSVQYPKLNVIQKGLVELVSGASALLRAFDSCYIGSDAQTIVFTGSNAIGKVDPGFAGLSGKQVYPGDLVKIWVVPASAYDLT